MFTAIITVGLLASVCFDGLLPIREQDLLEPQKRWPDMVRIQDSTRAHLLDNIGYADSLGAIPNNIRLFELHRCPYTYGGAENIELVAYLVRGAEGDRDESVWLVTWREKAIVARTLIGQLQTNCSSTYLRGCSVTDDGGLLVQQLTHSFECETDEFLRTERLPSLNIYFRDDGTFEESVISIPSEKAEGE